jgi:hypothetical protein
MESGIFDQNHNTNSQHYIWMLNLELDDAIETKEHKTFMHCLKWDNVQQKNLEFT